jgi:glutamate transport system substrate-binding protein
MADVPALSRSRAILIGTAKYRDRAFPGLPAATNSVAAVRGVLSATDLCGWPADRITTVENATDVRRLLQSLRRLAHETTDVLLVYFVGHGVILRRGELCLTLSDTDSEDPDITGLEFTRLREVLLDSPASVKIAILDCCYSGRAIEALGDDIADVTDTRGVYTLTASDHTAHVVPSQQQKTAMTSFTSEFVELIRDGIASGPERLTLNTLYLHLRHRLHQRGLPAPNQRGTDTADRFPFTRNAAFQTHHQEQPTQPPTRSATLPRTRPEPAPRRWLPALMVVVVLIATVVIVWVTSNSSRGGDNNTAAPPSQTSTVASSPPVQLVGSPTFDRIRARGSVFIGAKEDQPGLGLRDGNTRSGFDIEIAKLIADRLGYHADKITYKTLSSVEREQGIINGDVDLFVGTYTITERRKDHVSFAGPYFLAGQDLLVRKQESAIIGKDTLKGKKVCSVTGSTPIHRVRTDRLTEESNIVEYSSYAQCVDALLSNEVDALTTDDAILRGYATYEPDRLRVVGRPFSDEPYGVGMAKDDKVLRDAVNDVLQQALDNGTWQAIYDSTLGKSGPPARKPTIQRY